MNSKEIYNWLNDLPKKSIGTYPLTFEQIRSLNNYLNEKIIGKKEYKDYLFINNNNTCRKKTKIEGCSSTTNDLENKIEYNSSELGKVCGYTFKPGDTIYRCLDCGFDESCVLCSKCFNSSNHSGHNIKIRITNNGGGCCDCGDEEAFVVDIQCKYHNKKDINEDLLPLPEYLKMSIRNVISQCLDFIIDTLKKSPEKISVPENVQEVRKEEKPDSNDKLYCCLLWNDEKHSFNTVIKQLKEAIKCTTEKAINISKNVDVHGRECISISENLDELKIVSDIINRVELRTTIRLLSETIKEEIVSFLIIYFSKLLKNVPGIISINGIKYESVKDTIRKIINEEFFKKVNNTEDEKYEIPFYLDKNDILRIDLLFYYDIRLWKSTRVLIKELFVNTLIADQESKTKTAYRYSLYFPYFINTYLSDIEDTNNIAEFIIQTISPTTAKYLFNETNFFFDLLNMIKAHIFCNSDYRNSNFSRFLECYLMAKEQKSSDFNAESLNIVRKLAKGPDILMKMVEGIRYILQAPIVQSHNFRENNHFIHGVMETLIYIQSYNPQKCYLDVHISTESNAWIYAKDYAFYLGRMIKCISDCYKYDKEQRYNLKYIKSALTNILVFIDEWCRKRKLIEKRNETRSKKKYFLVKEGQDMVFRVLNVNENTENENTENVNTENENTENNHLENTSESFIDLIMKSDLFSDTMPQLNTAMNKTKNGFHMIKSLDYKLYEVPNYSVLDSEISFFYPLHWLFASCIRKLPQIVENLNEEEKENNEINNLWNEIFSFIPLTNEESDLTLENRILRIIDYPLQCMTVFSQINSNIWIRNGHSIYQMAAIYSNLNIRMNSITYESNIIILQAAMLVLPGDLFLTSLLDRYGIFGWFVGRPVTNARVNRYDYEKINNLVSEFLMLIIKLLTFRLEINGKNFEENLKTEIIHILVKKPMSFSKISKKVEIMYADLEKDITKDIENILNEISNFKFPDSVTDRGMYELKTQYYDEVDPWHYSLTFNEREAIKELLKNHILKNSDNENKDENIENIVLKPRMEKIVPTSSFSKLPNICKVEIFIRIVFMAIWNTTKKETENKEETTDETPINIPEILDQAIYLVEIAIEEEKRSNETKKSDTINNENSFIINASKVKFEIPSSSMDKSVKINSDDDSDIKIEMIDESVNNDKMDVEENKNENENENENEKQEEKENINKNEDDKKITLTFIDWLIYIIEKSDSSLSNVIPRFCAILKDISELTVDEIAKEKINKWFEQKYLRERKQQQLKEKEEEEAKMKKRKAKERRAQIMAQFATQQNDFLNSTNFDFDDDEFNDENLNETEEDISAQQNVYQFPTGTCIMCRENEETEDNIIGILGYAQTSSHVRHIKFNETDNVIENLQMNISYDQEQKRSTRNTVEKSKEISVLPTVSPISYTPGIYVSSCGHMMHMKCLNDYVAYIKRNQQSTGQRNFSVNLEKNEFLCPFCKNLCNILLPIVWKDKQYSIKVDNLGEEKEDESIIEKYSLWLSKITDVVYNTASESSNKNKNIFKCIEEFNNDCENSLKESSENNKNKMVFEIKSNIKSDNLKQIYEKKIINTIKYIKANLLFESIKTLNETEVNVDILHEVYTSTIQTLEVMMRGAKQDSSSESSIVYPYIGIIEHANPKITNLLRILCETILTFFGIQIKSNILFKDEYLKHVKKIAYMIFGGIITKEKKIDDLYLNVKNKNNDNKLSSDDSEYFSANMEFNDDDEDDDIKSLGSEENDEMEVTHNESQQNVQNEIEIEEDLSEDENNDDEEYEDIDRSIDLDTDQENRDIIEEMEELENQVIEQEEEERQGQGQLIIDGENIMEFEVVSDEDVIVDDYFDEDEDDEEFLENYNYSESLISLINKPLNKTKSEKEEIKQKEILCPIQGDTFALFVSTSLYMIKNDKDIQNWTFLFYSMEIVKCLLGIAESVGVFGDEWLISPKIKKLMKNVDLKEIKKSSEKGKEKETETEMEIGTETTENILKGDNSNDKNQQQSISNLLYYMLKILNAKPEVVKRCKCYLTEKILEEILKSFTLPFLRQSILLMYSKFYIQPKASEVDPEINEYDRSINFLGLPSTISKACSVLNNNKEMKKIIEHWCKQWIGCIKVNPFEKFRNKTKNTDENYMKRERRSETNKANVLNSSSSMKIPVVISHSALASSTNTNANTNSNTNTNTNSNSNVNTNTNANATTILSTSIENVASMDGEISISLPNKNNLISATAEASRTSSMTNSFDLYKIRLQAPSIIEMFPLSTKINDLIVECAQRKCRKCKSVPNMQAICLLCGEIICFQSFCCNENNFGECYCHSQRCGKSIGMYLIIKKCMVYINSDKNGSFLYAPYLDIHGEPDEAFKRGKPQFLSPRRYDELRRMWLNKTIPSYIAQRLENTEDDGGWETI